MSMRECILEIKRFFKLIMKICIVDLNINFRYKRNVLMPIITHIATSLFGVPLAVSVAHVNRARKSRTTLQNKVKLKVLPEQLTLFVNMSATLKKCIIQ